MGQLVIAPDGTRHIFPDNATPDQMTAALKPPASSFFDTYVTTPARRAAADLTGMIGSADNTMAPTGQGPLSRMFAGQFLGGPAALGIGPGASDAAKVRFPTVQDMGSVIGRGQDAPTATGRIVQTATEGGLASLPFAGAGILPMAMGAASGGAQQTAQEMNLPPMAQQAAGYLPMLLGGLAGAGKMGAKTLGLTDPANVMKSKIVDALTTDGVTPQQALSTYQNWRMTGAKPETLMDLGGDATRRLARSVYTVGGPAASTVESNLGNRGDNRAERILGDFNDTARNGAPAQNIYDASGELQQQRQQDAAPLYKQAFAANQNIEDPVINRLMQTPAMKLAQSEALTRMQNQMQLVSSPDPELTAAYNEAVKLGKIPEGQGTGIGVGRGLKLRYLDYLKQSLDGIIKRAGGFNSDPSVNPEKVGSLQDLKDIRAQFVKALDANDVTAQAGPNSVKPEGGLYAQARGAYSGPSQSLDALDLGRDFLKQDPEVIKSQVGKLSKSDADFYRIGAARALQDQMGGAGGANTMTAAYSDTPRYSNMRAKIEAVFGNQFTYDRFAKLAAREANMAKNERFVLGGSQTANKIADAPGIGAYALEGGKAVAASVLSHNPSLVLKWLMDVGGNMAGRAKGITPDVAGLLAPALTDPKANIEGLLGVLLHQKPKSSFLLNHVAPAGLLSGRFQQ